MPMALFRSYSFAHRGLHNADEGVVENSVKAVQRAIESGFGVEIDIQPSSDQYPMVFHDETLDRLTSFSGQINKMTARELKNISYSDGSDHISSLDEILSLINGKVPLLIEIKSDWSGTASIEKQLCSLLRDYEGVCGIMSFDPSIIRRLMALQCSHSLGLVTTSFIKQEWKSLEKNQLNALRCFEEAQSLELNFVAHDIRDLNNPSLQKLLNHHDAELLSWTIRTQDQLALVKQKKAIPIFEGNEILPFISEQLGDL